MNSNDTVLLHEINDFNRAFQSLKCWIVDQEKRINELEAIVEKITQDGMIAGRKPHKCPTCKGTGIALDGFNCVSCDGCGVVWG